MSAIGGGPLGDDLEMTRRVALASSRSADSKMPRDGTRSGVCRLIQKLTLHAAGDKPKMRIRWIPDLAFATYELREVTGSDILVPILTRNRIGEDVP
ncbi:MAG: hypothetical protein M1457_08915 [bacterium]|nr:hypothetical protein [bacterium]